MAKKFQDLHIPELNEDLVEIQAAHCDSTTDCSDSCDACLFSETNINKFTEYFNRKRLYQRP